MLSNLFGGAEAFARTWEICSSLAEIWVDVQWTGIEKGTRLNPFNTLAEGLAACQPGNALWLKPGAYTYGTPPSLIKQRLTLRAYGGEVLINNRIKIQEGGFILLNEDGGIRTAGQ